MTEEVPSDQPPVADQQEEAAEQPNWVDNAVEQKIQETAAAAPKTSLNTPEISKAVDMAYAGKPEKDEAALQRESAESNRALVAKAEELARNQARRDQMSEVEKAEHDRELEDFKNDRINDWHIGKLSTPTAASIDAILEGRGDEPWLPGTNTPKQDIERENAELEVAGEALDKRGDKLGEWAGILHDHPVSEAYIAAHQNVIFGPRELVAREDALGREKEYVLEKEKTLMKLKSGDVSLADVKRVLVENYAFSPEQYTLLKKSGKNIPEEITREVTTEGINQLLADERAKDLYERLLALYDKPEATLKEAKQLYEDIYIETEILPIRQYITKEQEILDDIRSGRAADPNYTAAQSSQEAKVSA